MQDKRDDKAPKKPDSDSKTPLPPAGPHAKPELTDYEKTPGTGSLPDDTAGENDVGPD